MSHILENPFEVFVNVCITRKTYICVCKLELISYIANVSVYI